MTAGRIDPVRRARAFVLAGIVSALLPAAAAAQLEVDQLEITLRAGEAAVGSTFTVRNTASSAHTAVLGLRDWSREEDGTNRFVEPGSVEGACSESVTVFPNSVQLDPGESQTVQVTYDGGPRSRACWSAISVATAPTPSTGAGGVRILVTLEHIVKIYIDPPLVQPGMDLVELGIEPMSEPTGPDSAQHAVVGLVRNTGNAQIRVGGRVEYRTLADSVAAQVVIAQSPILPDATWRLRSPLPALAAGRYVIVVLLDYGGADIVAGQIELEIE